MDIIEKPVQDLTAWEVARCKQLTYGEDGWMEEEFVARLDDWWRHKREAIVLMAKDGEYIVGWALLQPIHGIAKYKAYFFVEEARRREGIGSTLLEKSSAYTRFKPRIIPGDNNIKFFERHNNLWTR